MTSAPEPEADGLSWFRAVARTLDPLLNSAALVALIQGAEAAGLLRALRTTTTPEALARETGIDESRVRDIGAALEAGDVVERVGSGLRLTADWAALTGAAAFSPLAEALRMNDVATRALQDLSGRNGFADLSSADRLTYAIGVSPDPFSSGVVALVRQGAWTPASLRARVRDDDRQLELGCGVAGRILSALQAFPAMTAVGVELDPGLAAEARRRAERLGVADRFEVVCADARDVRLDGEFDVVTWSQFFFPEGSRWETLATAYTALRPGGLLIAPLLGDDDAAAAEPHGAEARALSIARVVHGGWGVPSRSAADLVDEVGAAGFVGATVTPASESPLRIVYANRP